MNEERGSATIEIDAPPEIVFALVSDVGRMGEFSDECHGCEWTDGHEGPAAGATFLGHNKAGDFEWSVPCTIRKVEPGRVFEFTAGEGETATTWTFTLERTGGGTRLTEAFHAPLVNVDGAPSNFPQRPDMLVAACENGLARIKAAAEAP